LRATTSCPGLQVGHTQERTKTTFIIHLFQISTNFERKNKTANELFSQISQPDEKGQGKPREKTEQGKPAKKGRVAQWVEARHEWDNTCTVL
jgi:hypothetical protein